jgi:hypothetical protein
LHRIEPSSGFAAMMLVHLTNRSRQPVAGVMTIFNFVKQFSEFGTLALSGGGSALAR